MKTKWMAVSIFAALCALAACSKKDSPNNDVKPPAVDSSKCLLTKVNYVSQPNMAYTRDPFTLTYDNSKRIVSKVGRSFTVLYSYESGKIIERSYAGSVADSNLSNRYIYILDNNSRIVYHINYYYVKPKSEDDYLFKDSTDYQYDTEGYLLSLKLYSSNLLVEESKFIYQNGNLAQREKTYYQFGANPAVKRGADTLTYTYDSKPWYPESAYLYEVQDFMDIKTGKPNKNNVTGIQCKMYDPSGTNLIPHYTSIQYVYLTYGPKISRVDMTATTTKDQTINTYIGFEYKCD